MFPRRFAGTAWPLLALAARGIVWDGHAQPGSLDLRFHPGSATDGMVSAMARQSTGQLLIGGNFNVVEQDVRPRVARLHADGSVDSRFRANLDEGTVFAIAVQDDDKVLIGGDFTNVHGAVRHGIARLNADGSLDTSFGFGGSGVQGAVNRPFQPGSMVAQTVRTIALQPDGKILVGGGFTNVNGAGRRCLARLNPDGSLDAGFGAGLAGADYVVFAMVVQSDGKVVIGGEFSTVHNVGRQGLARLHPDGTVDNTFFNDPYPANHYVYAVTLQTDGRILVGGAFTSVHGVSRNRIARLLANGAVDGFAAGLGAFNGPVQMISAHTDGSVLIGGNFTSIGNTPRLRVARLNPDGSLDAGFLNGLSGPEYPVLTLMAEAGGKVLLGGGFAQVNGAVRRRIARLNADGTLDGGFGSGSTGIDPSIEVVSPQSDGTVLIGGTFGTVAGTTRRGIARLLPNGSVDAGFGAGLEGVNGTVRAVVRRADGRLVIGGNFDRVHGTPRFGLARLHPNGTLDPDFNAALSGTGDWIRSLILRADGRIVIAGDFGWVNGTVRPRLALLNQDGSRNTGFPNGSGPDGGQVRSAVMQSDGKLILGGDFTSLHGVPRGRFARLHADGSLDSSFAAGLAGANGPVYAVALQSNGQVLIAGGFWEVHGVTRSGLARLHADGSLDSSFGDNPFSIGDYYVFSLAVQNDQKILVGGSFLSVQGVARTAVARLDADGSLDTSFVSRLAGENPTVFSMQIQDDGTILIGGQFSGVNERGRSQLARLHGDNPPLSLALSGTMARLSWPSAWTGFTAQASQRLEAPWGGLDQTPMDDGAHWSVQVPATNAAAFYRLKR